MFKQTICLVLCVLLMAMMTNAEAEDGHRRCVCKITKEYRPVCGIDNQTYDNWRKLACKNKCEGTNITVNYNGKCAEDTSSED